MSPRFPSLVLSLAVFMTQASFAAEPTAAELEAFFDNAWQVIEDRGGIPGGVVVVANRDGTLFSRGYGTSDIRTGASMSPEHTLLKIGSISKLFTAIAAMSLAEEGKLGLDQSVSDFVPLAAISEGYDGPVTIRDLMLHQAGFDSNLTGYMTYPGHSILVSEEEFSRHLVRMRKAGRVTAYDNTGASLLGYIVGKAYGGSYADAVNARVFEPLGMTNSVVGQPPGPNPPLAACHYVDRNGDIRICELPVLREPYQGAGAITSTAMDMSRFMQALLNGGALNGSRILSAAAFSDFANFDHHRLHPALPGLGYIVREYEIGGHRGFGHNGGFDGFSTRMVVFPESNIAVFMCVLNFPHIPNPAQNLAYVLHEMEAAPHDPGAHPTMIRIQADFAEKFLGETDLPGDTANLSGPGKDTGLVAGRYRSARLNGFPLLDRMLARLQSEIEVEAFSDKAILLNGSGPFEQTAPLLFVSSASGHKVAFATSGEDVLFQDSRSSTEFMKLKWYDSKWLTVYPFAPILLVLLAGAFGLPKRAWDGRYRSIAGLAVCACLLVSTGLLLEFQYFPDVYYLQGGQWPLLAWRALTHLGAIAALAMLFLAFPRLVQITPGGRGRSYAAILYLTAEILSALALLVLLVFWRVLGHLY